MALRMMLVNKKCFKNATFGADVTMTSQYNVKSNASYAMTSMFWRGQVNSINKSSVLRACAYKNCLINTQLSLT